MRIAANGVAAAAAGGWWPSRRPCAGRARNEETAELAGEPAIEGARAAAAQRLQGAAAAQPGEARHPRAARIPAWTS